MRGCCARKKRKRVKSINDIPVGTGSAELPLGIVPPPADDHPRKKTSRLWLWFVAVFLLQLGAWTAWFVIASRNHVEEVPLATGTIR